MAQCKWSNDCKIYAVGPAWVSQIPIDIVGLKIQAVVHICFESCDSECRDWHSFGCTCGAGSVELDKYAFRSDFSAGLQRLIGNDELIDRLFSVMQRTSQL